MKKPNFFIIGAPKCGTTSMSAWLGEHPQIFMSDPKELYFFSKESNIPMRVESLNEYLQIFRNASDQHIAVGEASTTYLFCHDAVTNILEFNPVAKFIVMLRNPVNMAPSLHGQFIWSIGQINQQVLDDFEEDWKVRCACTEFGKDDNHRLSPVYLRYDKVCKLGEQVQRLLQIVEAKSVLFIVMDDLISNPLQEYQRVLEFLDVPYDGRSQFSTQNSAKRQRFKIIQKMFMLISSIKRQLGIKRRFGLLKKVRMFNEIPYKTPPLRPEFKQELIEFFREDVQLLSSLLNRDFSHWLQ